MEQTSQFDQLRERVKAVRDNFRANPEIKWLPLFRRDHPEIPDWKFRNVYYLQSTDEHVTELLENHWLKYSSKTIQNGK